MITLDNIYKVKDVSYSINKTDTRILEVNFILDRNVHNKFSNETIIFFDGQYNFLIESYYCNKILHYRFDKDNIIQFIESFKDKYILIFDFYHDRFNEEVIWNLLKDLPENISLDIITFLTAILSNVEITLPF